MTEQQQDPRQPTEEELRAAYEEQLKQIRVEDVLVQTVLSLINLGSLRAGLVPGNESEADPQQLRQAIEAVRALLPQVEPVLGPDARQIRDAVSRLQMEYARLAGAGGAPGAPGGEGGDGGRRAAAEAGRAGAGADQRQALGSGALTAGRAALPPRSSLACAPAEQVWRPRGRLLPFAYASARRVAVTRIRITSPEDFRT
jgi:hypothetical protein